MEQFVGRGEQKSKPVDLPLSPRAKKVLDLAMREARGMSVNYVGTEHILLGLISEGEGIAAQILGSIGMDLEKIRTEVIAAISAGEGARRRLLKALARIISVICGRSRTPTLDQLGIALTEMAQRNELDPVIAGQEVRRLIQILSRRSKNNPELYSDHGVGKTAIWRAWPKVNCR